MGATGPDGANNLTYVRTLYGDSSATWADVESQREKSWSFNGNASYLSFYIFPTATSDSYPGDHSIPTKLPAILIERPMYYGMINTQAYLDQGIKNLFYGASALYTGYRPWPGEGDYFDSRFDTQLSGLLNDAPGYAPEYQAPKSPYNSYILGVAVEDSDELWGLTAGQDFRTLPAGHGGPHLGWVCATASPVQTANRNTAQVYADTLVYSKAHWQSMMASKYGAIGMLNAAWGSNYTTFGSSGLNVTAETFGAGNGSQLTFSHTLSKNASVSRFSVQILVAGKPVGGDQGDGTIWGPNLTGTVNYSTGVASITFASGQAPAKSAAITVNYTQNGWGLGTGLMDEDGRNLAWWGSGAPAYNTLTSVNANVQADLNDYLYDMANWFFGHSKAGVAGWTNMSGVLYLGPDSLFTWRTPPRAQVLQAAANSVQVILAGGVIPPSQSELDFVQANAGDVPILNEEFKTANLDSIFDFGISSLSCTGNTATVTTSRSNTLKPSGSIQISGTSVSGFNGQWTVGTVLSDTVFAISLGTSCPASSALGGSVFWSDSGVDGYPSQAARGQGLIFDVTNMLTASYTATGTQPFVGYTWWQFVDNPSEQLNWGLVTTLDNAYDGIQDTAVTTIDTSGYRRGGEPANYGDLISYVIAANNLWVARIAPGGAAAPTKRQFRAVPRHLLSAFLMAD